MRSLGRIASVGAFFVLAGAGAAISKTAETGGSLAVNQCEAIIRSGSELALQQFLRRYPDADTICNALAATATETVGEHGDGPRVGPTAGT